MTWLAGGKGRLQPSQHPGIANERARGSVLFVGCSASEDALDLRKALTWLSRPDEVLVAVDRSETIAIQLARWRSTIRIDQHSVLPRVSRTCTALHQLSCELCPKALRFTHTMMLGIIHS